MVGINNSCFVPLATICMGPGGNVGVGIGTALLAGCTVRSGVLQVIYVLRSYLPRGDMHSDAVYYSIFKPS